MRRLSTLLLWMGASVLVALVAASATTLWTERWAERSLRAPALLVTYELAWACAASAVAFLALRTRAVRRLGALAVAAAPMAGELVLALSLGRWPAFASSGLGWALRAGALALALTLTSRLAARSAA